MTTITTGHAHIKIRLHDGGVALERCEDIGCVVDPDGRAGCGRLACPICGGSGANLSVAQEGDLLDGESVRCGCGHAWVPTH
jgi:hypothetical protein